MLNRLTHSCVQSLEAILQDWVDAQRFLHRVKA